jgi:type IV secretion system protein VirB9
MSAAAKKLAATGAALALLAASAAGAGETPRAGVLDARVRSVAYSEWQVYSIETSLRSVVTIEVAADESIRNVAIGDTVSWEVRPTANILFIKQREEAAPTNAVMTTALPNGQLRTYQLEFRQEKGDPSMVKVKFVYPQTEADKRKAQEERDRRSREASEVSGQAFSGALNYKYSMAGVSTFAPTDAWDNGQVTAFRFQGQTQVPAIYAVDMAGEERVVQVSMQGDVAVVGTVAPRWRLRIGSEVVCLYNEAYSPAAAPRGSGTVGDSFWRRLLKGSTNE